MNLALNLLLAIAVFAPAWALQRKPRVLKWRTRYLLTLAPALYTGLGWQLATFAYSPLGCKGGIKNLHSCWIGTVDVTPLIGHSFFLMIPFIFFAGPFSLWLLLNTAAEHIGEWKQKQDNFTNNSADNE